MKKSILFLAAFAALAFVSCTKEIASPETNPDEKLVEVVISASADATKSTLNGDTPAWEAGDELAVWDGAAVRKFSYVSGNQFTGSVADGTSDIQVAYPYTTEMKDGKFVPSIPAEQVIPAGKAVAPAVLAMSGSGKITEAIHLQNQACLLRFTVEDGTTEVTFHTGINDEVKLADASVSVTVKVPGSGVYNAAVKPNIYELYYFRAFAKKDGKTYAKVSATPIALKAGKGINLGTVDNGTESALIYNADDMVAYFANPVVDGYMMADIDLTGKTLAAVTDFAKKFDGQYFSVKNWESDGQPLFTSVAADGYLCQILIDKSCKFTPKPGDCGVIAGSNKGKMEYCDNCADVTVVCDETAAQYRFGGVVGINSSYIYNCFNYGNISFTFNAGVSGTQYIGGVCGVFGTPQTGDRIVSCSNMGAVTVTGAAPLKSYYVGGVVGASGVNAGSASKTSGYTKHYGNIRDCFNSAPVTVNWGGGTGGYIRVGGIAGYCEGSIISSNNLGAISLNSAMATSSSSPCVGGIAGVLAGPGSYSDGCSNKGEIRVSGMFGNAANDYASGIGGVKMASSGGCIGLVGDSVTDKIANCTNMGNVVIDATMGTTAGSTCAYGGVVGYSKAPLEGCKNLSSIKLTTGSKVNYLGGVVGYCKGAISNCENTSETTAFAGTEGFSGNQAYQFYCGGICGYFDAPAATVISKCTCSSAITFDNAANSVFHYVGGILGSYKSGTVLDSCTSTSNVTSTSASGVRAGGLAGALNGMASNCQYNGAVSLLNATSETDKPASAALLAGYLNGLVSNCKLKGSIVSTAVAGTYVGAVAGVLGNSAEDRTITNVEIDMAAINTNSTFGFIAGRMYSADSFALFGAEDAPIKIKKTSSLNGTAIANTEAGTLVGDANSCENIKVINVVLE